MFSISLSLLLLLAAAGFWSTAQSTRRNAQDVLLDLIEEADEIVGVQNNRADGHAAKDRSDVWQRNERLREKHSYRMVILAVPLICVALRLFVGLPSPSGLLVTILIGGAVGYLAAEAGKRRAKALHTRQLDFFLPIVMERIVMAVQAGHDILAALKTLLDLEEAAAMQQDPVTRLIRRVYKLAESGVGLEQGLHEVAATVNCPAIRHAFIHLAQAHKEGGELVMPLRELSDSTQLYYQESIEEEIAKLPVKATLPLLCTFAGLIIFFLTAPMMQVLDITTKAMPR